MTVTWDNPTYGHDLVLWVSASATDNTAMVYRDNVELLPDPVPLTNGEPTPVTVPTATKLLPGRSHTLRVYVSNGDTEGSKTLSVTPSYVTSTVNVASTTVYYGSPLYGRLDPTAPNPSVPAGQVEVTRGDGTTASNQIRTDRTFGVTDLTMTPGTYPGVTVSYAGDPGWAKSATGGGGAVVDLEVRKAPTWTSASLNALRVTAGDPVVATVKVRRAADSLADLDGRIEIWAREISDTTGAQQLVATATRAAANEDVQISLTEWAATHPGEWIWRVDYEGSTTTERSNATANPRLVIDEPGAPQLDTTTALRITRTTEQVPGDPFTLTAEVRTKNGPVSAGVVRFNYGSAEQVSVPLDAQGTAVLQRVLPADAPHLAVAYYDGGGGTVSSQSDLLSFQHRTVPTMKVSAPAGSIPAGMAGTRIPVEVAKAGAGTPTGAVTLIRGGAVVARADLTAGRADLVLPALGVGEHTFEVRYAGDDATQPATPTSFVVVASPSTTDPEPSATTTTVSLDRDSVAVGGAVSARATVAVASGAAPIGQVSFLVDGSVVATQPVSSSRTATVQLPSSATAAAGSRVVTARYLGSETQLASGSAARTLTVTPVEAPGRAPSKLMASAKAAKNRSVAVSATLTSASVVAGQVKVYVTVKKGKQTKLKLVATGRITTPATQVKLALKTKRLTTGRQVLTLKYAGTDTVAPATKVLKVRIR